MEEFTITAERPAHRIGRQRDSALDEALLQTLAGGAVRIPLKRRRRKDLGRALQKRAQRLGYKLRTVLDGNMLVAWLGEQR